MAYSFDTYDSSIVLNGMQNGVADSPYDGISDMRNVDISTIPGESPVNFKTSVNTAPSLAAGTVVSANSGTNYITYTGSANLENGMALTFSGGSLPSGLTAGVVYWVGNLGGAGAGTFIAYSDIGVSSAVAISGTGTGSFQVTTMAQPRYFAYDQNGKGYWLVDSAGLAWTNAVTTATSKYWVYAGNKPNSYSNGNGIFYYQGTVNGAFSAGYIFVLSNSSIDYINTSLAAAWQYQWSPAAGTVGSWSATPTNVLVTKVGSPNPHEATYAPDNSVYFVDGAYVQKLYQAALGTAFVPTTIATYVYPGGYEIGSTGCTFNCFGWLSQSVALLGSNTNVVYLWDTTSAEAYGSIVLPENGVYRIVCVNTNAYLFAGTRGRIYITNSAQAQLFKKIPDHTSGTIEPYLQWGGATFTKNRLYCSVNATDNNGNAISQYGGLWCIDLDTGALWLSNQLSYGTYAGYATCLIADFSLTPRGSGIIAGWDSGASTYGVDSGASLAPGASSSPYTAGASIDFDLVPIGTYNKPRNLTRVEVKFSRPLVSGETVTVNSRSVFNTQNTGYSQVFSHTYSGLSNELSFDGSINLQNLQWIQIQVVLSSTASSPSYCRFVQARILGLVGPTLGTSPILSA